jgi:hypothetical protein
VAVQAFEIMGKWEDEIIGNIENGMMSIKLKKRRE